MNNEVYKFIDSQRSKGATDQEIIKKLLNAGWEPDDINQVIGVAAGKPSSQFAPPAQYKAKSSVVRTFITIALLFVIVGIFAWLGYWWVDNLNSIVEEKTARVAYVSPTPVVFPTATAAPIPLPILSPIDPPANTAPPTATATQPTTAPYVAPTSTPVPKASNFTSKGARAIDDGVTAHATSATMSGSTITLTVTYKNTSSTNQVARPIRLSMYGGGLGTSNQNSILEVPLNPGESKVITHKYNALDASTFTFKYAMFDGSGSVELGTLSP